MKSISKYCWVKSVARFALSLSFLLTLSVNLAWAGSGDTSSDSEVVVSLRPGTDIAAFCARYRLIVKEKLPGVDQYRMALANGERRNSKLAALSRDSVVSYAVPNSTVVNAEVRQRSQAYVDQRSQAYVDGNAPANFFGQPQVLRMNMSQAQIFSRGFGVRVAVIDTGIDFTHPLLAGRIVWPNYDFVDEDANPQEVDGGMAYGHGTFVAGLIALSAPGAEIMPLRTFGPDGSGTTFNIAKAIRYAVDNGAKVINMSFGMLERDKLIEEAMEYASSRALMVASAGNDDLELLHYPSSNRNLTLSVTSTDANDLKASFANYDRDTHTAAPGVNLYSAYPGGRWATWSGTSFSTALASGEAALIIQVAPTLSRLAVTNAIAATGSNLDRLNPRYVGKLGRRLDFLRAVSYVMSN